MSCKWIVTVLVVSSTLRRTIDSERVQDPGLVQRTSWKLEEENQKLVGVTRRKNRLQ